MTRTVDWDGPAFDLDPIAPALGPFPRRPFLESVTSRFPHGELVFVSDKTALVVFEREADRLTLAGTADLTDYHAPLGSGVTEILSVFFDGLDAGTGIRLDSLPGEAAEVVADAARQAGIEVTVERHEVAAVLDLPSSFDDYLASLVKKQRHEVRRKRRRFEETIGGFHHETHTGPGWGLEEFLRLHPRSDGDKGRFMDGEHAAFFRDLAVLPGWRIDLLRRPDREEAVAALFSFADDEAIYLYNSAYDPDLSDASPGVAMVTSMIERAIGEGRDRFDFLKGDEIYKFRLGAVERPLYVVEGVR